MDATREVLSDGHGLGDRFVAVLGAPRDPGWLTADELFGPGLPAVLEAVTERRGADRRSVAASLLFEQYALRIAAPVVAAWAREASVLDARPSRVRVLVRDGSLCRVAFADRPAPGTDRAAVVASLRAGLEPVADAVARHTRIGRRTLHGAVANAVAIAFLHLSWPETDRARYVGDATAVVAALPGCAGTVGVETVDVDGESWMYTDRNTCCLAFRTSVNRGREQRYCSTCPVVPRSTIREAFARATVNYRERHG